MQLNQFMSGFRKGQDVINKRVPEPIKTDPDYLTGLHLGKKTALMEKFTAEERITLDHVAQRICESE
jgi:hypothetical protein